MFRRKSRGVLLFRMGGIVISLFAIYTFAFWANSHIFSVPAGVRFGSLIVAWIIGLPLAIILGSTISKWYLQKYGQPFQSEQTEQQTIRIHELHSTDLPFGETLTQTPVAPVEQSVLLRTVFQTDTTPAKQLVRPAD